MSCVRNVFTTVLAGLMLVSARAASGQATTIYSFDLPTGAYPRTGLTLDANGNLFGTTPLGGTYTNGVAFELTPIAGGGWTEKVLDNFQHSEGYPGSAFISDPNGNLYGVTSVGGSHGVGTIYELSQGPGGAWIEKVIYNFGSYATDGVYPNDGLAFDAQGHLYGTTSYGGSNGMIQYRVGGYGTVFELTPSDTGAWTETVIHSFGATSTEGVYPYGGVVIDPAGHLYGTTNEGGAYTFYEGGTVFELTPQENGSWTETILHSFDFSFSSSGCEAGFSPAYSPVLDSKGNLYGVTIDGGCDNGYTGTVFELSPGPGESWTEKEFSFPTQVAGAVPDGSLILDARGNLYGATFNGGVGDSGVAFELTSLPTGDWSESVLHSFGDAVGDGFAPEGKLVFDAKGNLLGTAQGGGEFGSGTVFELAAEGAPVATTIEFTANPDTNLVPGEPIVLTAKVAAASGLTIPTGTVTFTDPAFQGGGVAILPLKDGVAVYHGKVPSAGTYSIYASYSGATGFDASYSSTITRTVTAPPQ